MTKDKAIPMYPCIKYIGRSNIGLGTNKIKYISTYELSIAKFKTHQPRSSYSK